jgi:putative tryptophan/tyrosine transport system substrate-binding protein
VELWSAGSIPLPYSNTPTPRRQLKFIWFALCALLFALSSPAEAQQTRKIPRVGILEPGYAELSSQAGGIVQRNVCKDSFRHGLSDLGYVEGQSIALEYRYAESKSQRLPDLAGELVQLKPDVIWTHSPPSVLAAKQATTTIPIVVGVARDLVEQRVVASLARPGGNITGMEYVTMRLSESVWNSLSKLYPKHLVSLFWSI